MPRLNRQIELTKGIRSYLHIKTTLLTPIFIISKRNVHFKNKIDDTKAVSILEPLFST